MNVNWMLLAPELFVLGAALVVLGFDFAFPRARKETIGLVATVGALAALAMLLALRNQHGSTFGQLLVADSMAFIFRAIILCAAIVVSLASVHFAPSVTENVAEYYALLLLSVLGLMLTAAAGDLLTAFLAIELSTISLYALAGYVRRDARSAEAGLKYLLLGIVASGLLIYGTSLVYGSFGTTRFQAISEQLASQPWAMSPAALAGIMLVIAGFGFKITAAPFHMWAPDVYQGAPTTVTAFLSVASKAAGFAILMRVLLGPFMSARPQIAAVVALACALSLLIGNLSAIPQTNIKRMLAYSGIAHAGYVLIGIAALSQAGAAASIFYLVQYVFANAGAFLVVAAVAQATGKEEIADYAGLAQRNPPLAFAMLLLLLSLGGIPPLAGFWAKVYVFVEAARSGLWWLVLLGALLSVVALYYYLMVVKQMYIFPAAQRDPVRVKWTTGLAIGICTAAVVIIGYPRPYVQAAQRAAADAIFRQPHAVRLVVRRTSQQPIAGDARTAGPTRSALPASPPAGAH
jgi:NADH-quinone oxidoreductase subunit N